MFTRVTYSGTTPGADSNTYNLYNSTSDGGGSGFAMKGYHFAVLDIKNAAAGTLKAYKSIDRGVTWNQIEQFSVAAAPTAESNKYEFLVEPYMEWKLDWVNGGASQSTMWVVDFALTDRRASAGRTPVVSTFQSLGAAATATPKAAAGSLLAITASNRNAAVRYLQVFNSTSSTATVLFQWPIPAITGTTAVGTVAVDSKFFSDNGWPFSIGITWGVSTTSGSYVAATAGEHDVAGTYL